MARFAGKARATGRSAGPFVVWSTSDPAGAVRRHRLNQLTALWSDVDHPCRQHRPRMLGVQEFNLKFRITTDPDIGARSVVSSGYPHDVGIRHAKGMRIAEGSRTPRQRLRGCDQRATRRIHPGGSGRGRPTPHRSRPACWPRSESTALPAAALPPTSSTKPQLPQATNRLVCEWTDSAAARVNSFGTLGAGPVSCPGLASTMPPCVHYSISEYGATLGPAT